MNVKTLSAAATLFVATGAGAAHAQDSLESVVVLDRDNLTINCQDERLPTLQSVGAVLDTNNATHLFNQRELLVHSARRECLRGATSVVFVRDASTVPASLALAAIAR